MLQANILHLDLKLKNVLKDRKQMCVLMDFGNSIREDLLDMMDDFSGSGTRGYLSPEMIRNERPTKVSKDIKSIRFDEVKINFGC